MQQYIILLNFTEAGIKNAEHWLAMLGGARACLKSHKGRIDVYLTMGPYDAVAIAQAPSDDVMAAALLHLGAQGQIRTTCLKAFDEKQFPGILKIMSGFKG